MFELLEERKREIFNTETILKVELQVECVYKGEFSTDTLVIYTARSSAACGFRFKEGENYIIYGMSQSYQSGFFMDHEKAEAPDAFWTNHCTRTDEYNSQEAKELAALLQARE